MYLKYTPYSGQNVRSALTHPYRRDVAEVATLRAHKAPELLRVPLLGQKRMLVRNIPSVNSPERCSRSGNTSGTPSPGTLASSATRGKACACAQYLSGEHHLSSVHLLLDVSNAAIAQAPISEKCSRSGNTSGTPSPGTLASSATGIRKLWRKATCSLSDEYRTSTGKGK